MHLVMCIHSFKSLKESKNMRSIQIELLVGVWYSSSSCWWWSSSSSAELVDRVIISETQMPLAVAIRGRFSLPFHHLNRNDFCIYHITLWGQLNLTCNHFIRLCRSCGAVLMRDVMVKTIFSLKCRRWCTAHGN